MTDQPNADAVLIWSGEHHAYWRPNSAGYTTDGLAAGVYERAAALRIVAGCDAEKRVAIREIDPAWPILAALSPAVSGGGELPADVRTLVIAGRELWDRFEDGSDESRAMDKALEAFASRVPYANGPDEDEHLAAPSAPPAFISTLVRGGEALFDRADDPTYAGAQMLPDTVDRETQFEVWQDGMMVAATTSEADARHYQLVYAQVGSAELKRAVTIREVLGVAGRLEGEATHG